MDDLNLNDSASSLCLLSLLPLPSLPQEFRSLTFNLQSGAQIRNIWNEFIPTCTMLYLYLCGVTSENIPVNAPYYPACNSEAFTPLKTNPGHVVIHKHCIFEINYRTDPHSK